MHGKKSTNQKKLRTAQSMLVLLIKANKLCYGGTTLSRACPVIIYFLLVLIYMYIKKVSMLLWNEHLTAMEKSILKL